MLTACPNSRSLKFFFLLVGLLLVESKGWAQTIGVPTVREATVCQGAEITVEFTITNGNAANVNANQWFTSGTEFTIEDSNAERSRILYTHTLESALEGKKEFLDIVLTIQIPESVDYAPRSDYKIQVKASNSAAPSELSNSFTVKEKPLAPVVSNNGPVCEGSQLQLTAQSSYKDATYHWTGPNNFTSNDQNPVIQNVTSKNSGAYSVTITVDECTSSSSSTNVRINPPIRNNVISGDQLFCNTSQPSKLTGTTPEGGNGNYSYRWESSTLGPESAFNSAAGEDSLSGYQPETITTTTWFRRIATSGDCSENISNPIVIVITDTNVWTGTADSNWNNTANWSCNSLPTLETDVLIPDSLASENYPVIHPGKDAFAKNLTIEHGASVKVNDNWLRLADSLITTGLLYAESGSVSFEGAAAQFIPNKAFHNDRVQNLKVNNASGVTSKAVLEITGILSVQSGDFKTGNNLTLISSGNKTALIDGAGTGEISGIVKMQRYLDKGFGYKYLSTPFQHSTVGDFSAYIDLDADFPNFYNYDENRQDTNGNDITGWEGYTISSLPLNIMEGYAMNFGDSNQPQTIEISGTVNKGQYVRTLYNHNRTYTKGFNLVGNPYPSPIDWNATAGWTKTNIDNAIYFFTAGSTDPYTGTYSSYVNGITSDDGKSSNIIPSMQGFFVHVSDAHSYPVTATLGMTNEVRITDFSQPFLKQAVQPSPELIRITAGFEGEDKTDPAVIYFSSYATHSFEKDLDAHKLMNTAQHVPNFYSISPENHRLAINAVPNSPYKDAVRVPLGLRTEKEGTVLIKLKDLENFSSGTYIYLIDQENNISQNLLSNSEYRFQAKKGESNSRFSLLFSETRITDPADIYDEPFSVETGKNEKVLVRMNLGTNEKGILRVSTSMGQVIDVLKVAEKEIVEIHGIRSAGIYFISYLSDKESFTRKVLVNQ